MNENPLRLRLVNKFTSSINKHKINQDQAQIFLCPNKFGFLSLELVYDIRFVIRFPSQLNFMVYKLLNHTRIRENIRKFSGIPLTH